MSMYILEGAQLCESLLKFLKGVLERTQLQRCSPLFTESMDLNHRHLMAYTETVPPKRELDSGPSGVNVSTNQISCFSVSTNKIQELASVWVSELTFWNKNNLTLFSF